MDNLNQKLVNDFYNYYNNYYGADYRPNQGLHEITDTIFKYSVPGSWIDLGGGTSSLIWLPAFNSLTKVLVCDKYRESFYVQQQIKKSTPTGCLRHLLDRYNRSYEQLMQTEMGFLQIDLLSDFDSSEQYDNVTQFGLLGLCNSKEHYFKQLSLSSDLMTDNGVFIGANWILSKKHSKERKINNSFLSCEMIQEWCSVKKKVLEKNQFIKIENDPNYDGVLLYVFKNY